MPSDNRDKAATEDIEQSLISGLSVRGFRLTVVEGPNAGERWESTGERCTIGVHSSCDLTLTDPAVSRFHCELVSDHKRVRVRDLDSRNGVVVDGVRIRDAYVKRGSLLRLGRTVIGFQYLERNATIPLSERTAFGLLVGHSVVMKSMFAVLERAACSSATILLEGETGTGKSAAARSIHMESARKGAPLIMIDCSALPGNLLESELFGHEKGAFTGAHSRRVGAFEDASGGTIFLDELGELTLDLQAKLLSVLENREIRRIGSNHTMAVDVRVIAATNRNLKSEVNAARFREDLYYRLAVVSVEVPPLRKRLDDLPLLAARLLERLGVAPEGISAILTSEMLRGLRASCWPGNIRELRNYLERYLLFRDLEPEPAASPDAAGADAAGADAAGDHSSMIRVPTGVPFSTARQTILSEFERTYVRDLLHAHDGVVSRAAAEAGITRTYLYRLLQRHSREGAARAIRIEPEGDAGERPGDSPDRVAP